MPADEKELITRCQKGDQEAFRVLFSRYHDRIAHYCRSKMGDRELAEDLTQEIFLHAYAHLPAFRRQSTFYTWLYRIAHNRIVNYLRSKRAREVPLKEELLSPPVSPPSSEEAENLQVVLQHLPPKQRIVVELFDIEGVPHKEIAARLGISAGTVRSRLYYGRKKLREFLITRVNQL